MKFIHIADIHLGAAPDPGYPWGAEREKEILYSFHNIIDICNQQEVDLLLIAGDLFHKQPLIRELKEISYCFQKLTKTQVVLIAGNHDYISGRSNYVSFDWGEGVHMLSEASLDSIYLEDINTEVYGLSYHTRFIKEPLYDRASPGCEERINILLAHGGSEYDIPIDKKALLGNGFDYIALGHIHKPQMFGERMAYAGSLEPLDKTETGERGYILGEINKEGEQSDLKITFVPNSLRQYIKLELPVAQGMTHGELLDIARKMISEQGSHHLYLLQLIGFRDTDIVFHTEEFKKLGNVVEVIDDTVPDYDFETLYLENQDNIIGLYIKRIKEGLKQDEVADKALYYGIEALLGAKNYK
ncbi:DNA repair exonuclease [Anaerocolumna sp. AGMB13025]|uniref:metallophosphoesterase family protein n=1 Tax=Anaerocolumna sp. AGMB13025 TaxID=3039116 RepID=UPI00241E84DF|nr:DNA repair exonuclease [Anaerocolumna sp. AGMB13025]WFR57263.1 DNA repair exonuclease [Anaerocolumna sp. AGMB13025]